MSMIYPKAMVGGFKVRRVCKECGAEVFGTDLTNLSLNFSAHMKLHAKR